MLARARNGGAHGGAQADSGHDRRVGGRRTLTWHPDKVRVPVRLARGPGIRAWPGVEQDHEDGPALALIAAGAILAFAVHAHLRFFDVQIARWVIMLTGIAGLVIPRRGYSWLRRVTRRPHTAAGSGGGGRLRRMVRRSGAAAGADGGRRMPIGYPAVSGRWLIRAYRRLSEVHLE
jgi:hypothetical protein